jgi:Arc/MetJ family transcription regulator
LTLVYIERRICIYRRNPMPVTLTSIRLDTKLADKAVRVLGAKSRTEAVHIALEEIVRLNEFKGMMKKYGGKGSFAGSDE